MRPTISVPMLCTRGGLRQEELDLRADRCHAIAKPVGCDRKKIIAQPYLLFESGDARL
jgi:hypothetical protein